MRRLTIILSLILVACSGGNGGGEGTTTDGGAAAPEPTTDTGEVAPPVDPGTGTTPPVGQPDAGLAPLDTAPPPRDLSFVSDAPVPTQPDVTVRQQPLGGLCTSADSCATSSCVRDVPGGYCTDFCADAPCPEGGKCLPGLGTAPKMCYRKCTGNHECRGDHFCGGGVCVPRCQPGECQTNYRCDDGTGRCVYSPERCQPGDEIQNQLDDDCDDLVDEGFGPTITLPSGIGRIDLGYVRAGDGGLSRTLEFRLTESVGSFAVIAMVTDDSLIGLWSLLAPNGTELVDATNPFAAPNPSLPSEGALAALVPNAPARFQVQPGRYRLSLLKDGAQAWIPVSVLTRPPDHQGDTVLDINLYFVGTPGLSASTYQSNSKFGDVLDSFWRVLGQARIREGTVRAFDITGPNAQKYTSLDMSITGRGELPELLALSAAHPETSGLNLFFVQDVANYGALGIAGGLPGPPIIQGTPSSGVAVSLASYYYYTGSYAAYGVSDTAEAMAHEVGHYLGLFHTTERDGSQHDPMTDTPECNGDSNGDGVVDPGECAGRGAENLMFWSVSGSAQLSGQQRQVLRANPAVHDP